MEPSRRTFGSARSGRRPARAGHGRRLPPPPLFPRLPILLLLALLAAPAPALLGPAGAQDGASVAPAAPPEGPSPSDLALLFGVSIAVVAGIALYISRDAIARRRTEYDAGSYESQRDRDYEKYHSGWGDEYAAGDGADPGGRDDEGEAGGPPPGRYGGGAGPDADYYAVLGLDRGATAGEIKRRYRELAKRLHPDRTGGESGDAGRDMALINEAYDVLSDPGRRRRYDLRSRRRRGRAGR